MRIGPQRCNIYLSNVYHPPLRQTIKKYVIHRRYCRDNTPTLWRIVTKVYGLKTKCVDNCIFLHIWYFINKLSYLEICVPWPSHPPTPSTSFQVPFSVTLSELTEFPLFSENVSDKDPSDYQKVDNFHPLSPNTSSGRAYTFLFLLIEKLRNRFLYLPIFTRKNTL